MKKIQWTSLGMITALALAIGCQENNSNLPFESDSLKLPEQSFNYALPTKTESGIDYKDNVTNPISNNGATLGRVLFYDKKLSLNNQIACASCHHQENAFADNARFSSGFEGKKTTRNALAITNASLEDALFWDTRSKSLEDLSLQPIRNHIEMGIEDMSKLSVKLAKISYYPELFNKAFGSKEIDGEKIAEAMSQFMRSLVTYRSKFDLGQKNKFSQFSSQEMRGKELFFNKLHCQNCHGGANMNKALDGEHAFNIGLDEQYADNGVGALTANRKNNGVFKVPSLRNVALTAPYMHDGRFATLEQIVEHYDHSLKGHENLFSALKSFTWEGNGGSLNSGGSMGWNSGNNNTSNLSNAKTLNLQPQDKLALIAFLKTLSDESLLKDERFSSPFGQ
jgi:cytochrome c peroxidase